jgi:hypothetical protein
MMSCASGSSDEYHVDQNVIMWCRLQTWPRSASEVLTATQPRIDAGEGRLAVEAAQKTQGVLGFPVIYKDVA